MEPVIFTLSNYINIVQHGMWAYSRLWLTSMLKESTEHIPINIRSFTKVTNRQIVNIEQKCSKLNLPMNK